MGIEERRASRTVVSLAVTVIPRDSNTGQSLAVSLKATMVDMSVYGVRLRLASVQSGPLHIFYDFNDHPTRHLDLEIFDPAQGTHFIIAAHPVWFNRAEALPAHPFEVGMEFMAGPEDPAVLRLKALARPPSALGGWARKLFGGLGG